MQLSRKMAQSMEFQLVNEYNKTALPANRTSPDTYKVTAAWDALQDNVSHLRSRAFQSSASVGSITLCPFANDGAASLPPSLPHSLLPFPNAGTRRSQSAHLDDALVAMKDILEQLLKQQFVTLSSLEQRTYRITTGNILRTSTISSLAMSPCIGHHKLNLVSVCGSGHAKSSAHIPF